LLLRYGHLVSALAQHGLDSMQPVLDLVYLYSYLVNTSPGIVINTGKYVELALFGIDLHEMHAFNTLTVNDLRNSRYGAANRA
jgi:hypothetical protein